MAALVGIEPLIIAIAERAGITRDAVSDAIRGLTRPTKRTIDRLSQALGVPPAVLEALFPGRGRP